MYKKTEIIKICSSTAVTTLCISPCAFRQVVKFKRTEMLVDPGGALGDKNYYHQVLLGLRMLSQSPVGQFDHNFRRSLSDGTAIKEHW